MPPRLAIGHTDSAGETVQRMVPNSKVVKALQYSRKSPLYTSDFPDSPPTMFIYAEMMKMLKKLLQIISSQN
jgi:predicted dinucleotide-binding enzyme